MTALRHSIPPHSAPIDITEAVWLRRCLEQLLRGMVDIQLDPATHVETTAQLYRRIVASLVFVVVNYRSVSRPGQIGGRHTATYINPLNYRLRDVRRQEVSDVREENYVVLPKAKARDNARLQRQIEDGWFNLWKRYHHKPELPVRFTLNNALLFHATSPRPVFLSWFEQPAISASHRTLTPISMNAGLRELETWAAPGTQSPSGRHPGFTQFAEAFRAMYSDGRPDDSSIAAAMGRVAGFFGNLGGDCFFSIPTSTRIRSEANGLKNDIDLRAIVSVSLKHAWDAELYGAAWQFFSGIASQILCDIMSSEHLAQAHTRWDRTRANSVYLASHPLKHRLSRIEVCVDEVERELRRMVGSQALDRQRLPLLLAKATQGKRSAAMAAGFVNLMNLLADLLDDRAIDSISHSVASNRSSPKDGGGWIDMNEQLVRAAHEAADARTGRRTVELRGDTETSCLIARRLTHGPLARHADKEPEILRLIFAELLQNAANYGFIPSGGDTGRVPVVVKKHFSGDNTCYIVLENLISPEFIAPARAMVNRLRRTDRYKVASGLVVAKQIPEQLMAGDVQFSVGKAMPADWPGLTRSDLHTWRSTIVMEV